MLVLNLFEVDECDDSNLNSHTCLGIQLNDVFLAYLSYVSYFMEYIFVHRLGYSSGDGFLDGKARCRQIARDRSCRAQVGDCISNQHDHVLDGCCIY